MLTYSKIIFATLLLCSILTVSGCGKVSAPIAIEGSGYPHSYPKN